MQQILTGIAQYYDEKLKAYGITPQGVDWNGESGQLLRFMQIARLLPENESFSLADIGCGYGALLDYLAPRFRYLQYAGFDISASMVMAAIHSHSHLPEVLFHRSDRPPHPVDFCVASGIFNVCQDVNHRDWESYIDRTLDMMNLMSRRGFAFNCLTRYSDSERMRPDLYYADPCRLFDRCKSTYSKNVALLHDYGLYEFTILVRK